MNEIRIYCADGFGGCLTAYAAAQIIYVRKLLPTAKDGKMDIFGVSDAPKLYFCCSDKVFLLLKGFINSIFEIHQVNEDWIKSNIDENTFNLTPDLYDKDKRFFDKFNISWRQLKQRRSLDSLMSDPKDVCIAFATSQPNNTYPFLNDLVHFICQGLPDKKVYFPLVTNWAEKTNIDYNINIPFLTSKNLNLTIKTPEDIVEDYRYMATNCRWFIGVDNGIMNFAYHINAERMLLDFRNNPQFSIRWRQNSDDSINPHHPPKVIADAFISMVRNPELSGIPRNYLTNIPQLSIMLGRNYNVENITR